MTEGSKTVSLKKNIILNAILTVSNVLFPLITFQYVSTILGTDGYGIVDSVTSTVMYFAMFAQLGIPAYGIRACAKVRDNKEELTRTVHELFFINFIITTIVYVAFFLSVAFIPKFSDEKELFIIVGSMMFFNLIGVEHLYRGLEQYQYITKRAILFKVIAIVAMVILIRSREDYVLYGAITIIANYASYILNFVHARHYISFKPVGGYNVKRHLSAVGIFFAMACATTIYLNLDKVMLWFMTTETDEAYYGASVKIKTVLVTLVTSLGNVILPRASYYVENNMMEDFRKVTRKAMSFVFTVSVPFMIYFMIFSEEGILFLSTGEFLPAVVPMVILMPTLLIIGITNILGIQILVPLGKEKAVLYSEVAGALIDLIINLILIPRFRATGAAIGTLVAEIVVLGVQLWYISGSGGKVSLGELFGGRNYVKIFAAAALGAGLSLPVKFLDLQASIPGDRARSFVLLAISASIFFVAYAAVMVLTKDPMTMEIIGSAKGILRRHGGQSR